MIAALRRRVCTFLVVALFACFLAAWCGVLIAAFKTHPMLAVGLTCVALAICSINWK